MPESCPGVLAQLSGAGPAVLFAEADRTAGAGGAF